MTENGTLDTHETATERGAGPPLPPLLSYADEAAFWADIADPMELEVYCLAAFCRMPPGRQAAFIAHVSRRAAA